MPFHPFDDACPCGGCNERREARQSMALAEPRKATVCTCANPVCGASFYAERTEIESERFCSHACANECPGY